MLAVGFVVGVVPLAAAGAEVTATEGLGERVMKTAGWAISCGAIAWPLGPVVTGLHAVGAVGVATGVGAPFGVVAAGLGAAACGLVWGGVYFAPEIRGLGEVVKNEVRFTGKKLVKDAGTVRKRVGKSIGEAVEWLRDVRWE